MIVVKKKYIKWMRSLKMNRKRAIEIVNKILYDYAEWFEPTTNGKQYHDEVLNTIKYIKENLK